MDACALKVQSIDCMAASSTPMLIDLGDRESILVSALLSKDMRGLLVADPQQKEAVHN